MTAGGSGAVRRLPYPLDAVWAARVLAGSGRDWCWFDGASAAAGEPRVSYLGVAAEVRIAERGREHEFLAGLREWNARSRARDEPGVRGGHVAHGGHVVHGEGADQPGFTGGWAVALGYEFGVALLGIDPAPDEAAPGVALRLDTVLVIDHDRGVAELRGESDERLDAWLRAYERVIAVAGQGAEEQEPLTRGASGGAVIPDGAKLRSGAELAASSAAAPAWRTAPEEYEAEVESCREAIRDGDAYVLCLTDTASVRGGFAPLEVYTRLRACGGAVRGGVIVAGERALVSASPERFLSVRREAGGGRTVATHPIKGTRPRGATPEEDAALATELAHDPKERAENLMIVDLMRNDLSRVCAPGTVAVDGFLRVETHPHVHQLVSTVRGELEPGCDVFDAIAACFPGGSMTGAPKHRSVELLASFERGPRGLYSGCFGWIDRSGDAELAMTIRGIELRGSVALVGAGGGITADSDPARERAEKDLKAAPMLRVLGATRYP